jgi:hypothetical protein
MICKKQTVNNPAGGIDSYVNGFSGFFDVDCNFLQQNVGMLGGLFFKGAGVIGLRRERV